MIIITICGNIAATMAGITPNVASNHKTPYITIKAPKTIAALYARSFKSGISNIEFIVHLQFLSAFRSSNNYLINHQ